MSTFIAVVVLIASVIAIFTIPQRALKDGFNKSGVLITMFKMMVSVLAMLSSGLYLVL